MAAILGGQLADERRMPARHEAAVAVERAERGEARVYHPQLAMRVADLVDADVARDVGVARNEARIRPRLQLRRRLGVIAKVQHLRARAEGDAVRADGDAHGERSEERRVGKECRSVWARQPLEK